MLFPSRPGSSWTRFSLFRSQTEHLLSPLGPAPHSPDIPSWFIVKLSEAPGLVSPGKWWRDFGVGWHIQVRLSGHVKWWTGVIKAQQPGISTEPLSLSLSQILTLIKTQRPTDCHFYAVNLIHGAHIVRSLKTGSDPGSNVRQPKKSADSHTLFTQFSWDIKLCMVW